MEGTITVDIICPDSASTPDELRITESGSTLVAMRGSNIAEIFLNTDLSFFIRGIKLAEGVTVKCTRTFENSNTQYVTKKLTMLDDITEKHHETTFIVDGDSQTYIQSGNIRLTDEGMGKLLTKAFSNNGKAEIKGWSCSPEACF